MLFILLGFDQKLNKVCKIVGTKCYDTILSELLQIAQKHLNKDTPIILLRNEYF